MDSPDSCPPVPMGSVSFRKFPVFFFTISTRFKDRPAPERPGRTRSEKSPRQ
jgi:hypothetical protein